jgi:hypothetical protein
MATNTVLWKIEIDTKSAVASLDRQKKLLEGFKNDRKELMKLEKSALGLNQQQRDQLARLNDAIAIGSERLKQKSAEVKRLTAFETAQAGTLRKVNAELAIQRRAILDAVQGSEKYKVIAARIKDLERKQRDYNQEIGRGRTFVGEYAKGFTDAFVKIGAVVGGVLLAYNKIKERFGEIINSTQASGDAYRAMIGGMKESNDFFNRSLANFDFSNFLQGMSEAYEAGVRYAKIMDIIGDEKRSEKILQIKIDQLIEEQRAIAYNRSFERDIRMAALTEMESLEKQKLDLRIDIAKKEKEAIADAAAQRTKLSQDEVVSYIANYAKISKTINDYYAEEERITEENTESKANKHGIYYDYVTARGLDLLRDLKNQNQETSKLINIDKAMNQLIDEGAISRIALADAIAAEESATLSYNKAIASQARLRGQLNNAIKTEEENLTKDANAKREKELAEEQKFRESLTTYEERGVERTQEAEQQKQDALKSTAETAKILSDQMLADQEKAKDQEIQIIEAIKNARTGLQNAIFASASASLEMVMKSVGEESEAYQALFKLRKALALAEIGMNLYKELSEINAHPLVTLDTSQTLRVLLTTSAILRSVAATANVVSQKMAQGGVLEGKSHSQGGIYMGGGVEAEGGEVVINKRSSAIFRRELSDINQAGGGKSLMAAGGVMPPATPSRLEPAAAFRSQDVADIVIRTMRAIPVQVSEREIRTTSKKVTVNENLNKW